LHNHLFKQQQRYKNVLYKIQFVHRFVLCKIQTINYGQIVLFAYPLKMGQLGAPAVLVYACGGRFLFAEHKHFDENGSHQKITHLNLSL